MHDELAKLLNQYGLIGGPPVHRKLAKWLADRGVIVLPCKAGDEVWFIAKKWEETEYRVIKGVVRSFNMRDGWKNVVIVWTDDDQDYHNHVVQFKDFDETVFLNKEDAEQALLKLR